MLGLNQTISHFFLKHYIWRYILIRSKLYGYVKFWKYCLKWWNTDCGLETIYGSRILQKFQTICKNIRNVKLVMSNFTFFLTLISQLLESNVYLKGIVFFFIYLFIYIFFVCWNLGVAIITYKDKVTGARLDSHESFCICTIVVYTSIMRAVYVVSDLDSLSYRSPHVLKWRVLSWR